MPATKSSKCFDPFLGISVNCGPDLEIIGKQRRGEDLQLPDDDATRSQYPLADGLVDYFPNALAEVSKVSYNGNLKHNPGQPMHWARGKSTDHRNKIMRHLIDAGKKDSSGMRHSASLAWRALALLQEELERDEGYPLPRGATPPENANDA